jgi:hypothetical protein
MMRPPYDRMHRPVSADAAARSEAELIASIQGGRYDDVTLVMLRREEAGGLRRAGVLSAIDDRLQPSSAPTVARGAEE